jgi:hypothetical protein
MGEGDFFANGRASQHPPPELTDREAATAWGDFAERINGLSAG